MKVSRTDLPGVLRIEPKVIGDDRGCFCESWSAARYARVGIPGPFVQDNVSVSSHRTMRGLHLQHPHGQGKLIQVLSGEVFDVAVDVRLGSPCFGNWFGAVLSHRNWHQLYIPAGFAHGFCVVSETALLAYKCTERYCPETELTIAWDDSDIGIRWPIAEPILSAKDKAGRHLRALKARLPQYEDPEAPPIVGQ